MTGAVVNSVYVVGREGMCDGDEERSSPAFQFARAAK